MKQVEILSSAIILHLQANKEYAVTVTGWAGALYNTSAEFQFVTNSTSVDNHSIAAQVTVVVVIIIIVAAVIVCGLLMYRYRW